MIPQQVLVDSSLLSEQRRHLQVPTICAWTVEELEHITMHDPRYDVDIDKYV